MFSRHHMGLMAGSLLLTACASNRTSLNRVPTVTQPVTTAGLQSDESLSTSSRPPSAIYRGDPNEVTLVDVAVCLSAFQLPGEMAEAASLASAVNALLGSDDSVTAESFDPVAADAQCDYATPSGEIDLADVAVVLAALETPANSRAEALLASKLSNAAILPTFAPSATDILAVPGDAIPAPTPQPTPSVPANAIFVNTLNDENGPNPQACSLREAIAAHNDGAAFGGCRAPGGTIAFEPGLTGTLVLAAGELAISSDINIIGPGERVLAIDASQQSGVFDINDGSYTNQITVAISGVTVTGGSVNSSAIENAESLSLSSISVSGNSGNGISGGGTISDSIISDNSGTGISGDWTISNSIISDNSGTGIFNEGSTSIYNSTISRNTERGIFNDGFGSTVSITDSTIDGNGNTSAVGGGVRNQGTLTVVNSTISENIADKGGGISNGVIGAFARVSIENSTISGNVARLGGGLYNYYTGVGLPSNFTHTASITNSTISGNEAQSGGGISNAGILAVSNSTIAGNLASNNRGGGILNAPPADGEAKFPLNYSEASIVNSTITNNSPQGLFIEDMTHLSSTIVADNEKSDLDLGMTRYGGGIMLSSGFSLIESGILIGNITNDRGGNIIGQDPGLDPAGLQDNGGPTNTIALQEGSFAINAGSNSQNLTSDQRGPGFDRVVDGKADIGAFELQ